jgi:hypothetical protein
LNGREHDQQQREEDHLPFSRYPSGKSTYTSRIFKKILLPPIIVSVVFFVVRIS